VGKTKYVHIDANKKAGVDLLLTEAELKRAYERWEKKNRKK